MYLQVDLFALSQIGNLKDAKTDFGNLYTIIQLHSLHSISSLRKTGFHRGYYIISSPFPQMGKTNIMKFPKGISRSMKLNLSSKKIPIPVPEIYRQAG